MPKITPEESSPSSTAKNQAPPKRKRILWIAITVVVAIAGLIAWDAWVKSTKVGLDIDKAFNQALVAAKETGDPILVRDTVNFKWDEVALFQETTAIEEINAVVGETGLHGRYYSNSAYLFIFRHKGQIIKKLMFTTNVRLSGEFGRLIGVDAIIVQETDANGSIFSVLTN